MLLLSAFVLCVLSSIYAEQLHQHMTSDEIRSIFNVHKNDVHKLDYEVVEIFHAKPNNDHLHERKSRSAEPQLRITAFSQDYTLYLEENDNVLLGDETPIFLSENISPDDGEPNIVYSKIKYPSLGNFKLYHDVEKRVAISLEHENDDRFHVNGVIGDDIVIRSLPKRIHDEVLSQASSRSRRSSSSNDNGSRFGDAFKKTHHVFIKSNVTNNIPYFGSLNKTNRKYDFFDSILLDEEVRPSKSLVSTVKNIVYPQLLVTIDHNTYEVHGENVVETIKYMASFWNAVDLRFREMRNPKVRLNIGGLIIPKQPNAAIYLEKHLLEPGTIHVDGTLIEMGEYFLMHTKEFPLNSYDVIVAITNKELGNYDIEGNFILHIAGVSHFEGACRGRYGEAVSIVKDLGGYNAITTAAHEVAHSLGAPHDGPESATVPGGPCAWDDGYLMSYNRKDEKGMHFSKCSIRAMQDFMKRPKAKCLRNKPSVGKPYPKILPGKFTSRDDQCRASAGNNWLSFKEKEMDCSILWCVSDTKQVIKMFHPPTEGSYCAEKAICLNSTCVQEPDLT